jgi:hypothetical protein
VKFHQKLHLEDEDYKLFQQIQRTHTQLTLKRNAFKSYDKKFKKPSKQDPNT